MNIKGYIRLSRTFFDNPLWTEPREYSRAEAWLDLIQVARFEAERKILNGRAIEVQRGEIMASRRYLEKRWTWGSTKVANYLKLLVLEKMVTIKQTNGQTIITLCNYELYNDPQTTKQTADKPDANQTQTTDKPNIKKDKKENEGKKIDLTFVDIDFKEIVDRWLSYKLSKGQTYKNQDSIQTMYKKLLKFSANDAKKAVDIIEDAMAKNYSGFFEINNTIKNGNNSKPAAPSDEQLMRSIADGLSRARTKQEWER